MNRWIFSTDGVGFCLREDDSKLVVPETKAWARTGPFKHPPMFGIGPGIEQNTHKIGECVDSRELVAVDCVLSTLSEPFSYPSMKGSTSPTG